jgi:integrase
VDGRRARALLEHVADDRLFTASRVAATTGMRRAELLGLRSCDLDLDAGRLSIVETLIGAREASRLVSQGELRVLGHHLRLPP